MNTTHTDEEDYLSLMGNILDEGEARADRTGTGTYSIFAPPPLRFNLKHHFPLITTKKMAWKSIVAETLWFVQGRTDLESLRADGCTWWDDWEREDGSIGPGYGNALRQWYTPNSTQMEEVLIREDKYSDYKYPYISTFKEKIPYDLNSEDCWLVGYIEEPTPKLEIQFKSGYLTSITRADWEASKKKGTERLHDGYQRAASQIGFRGYPGNHDYRTFNLWCDMIARCYDPQHPEYKRYGGRGVTVSPVWHCFETFLTTVINVPGYHQWKSGMSLQLDKDYYGSEVYSPSTTVFLTNRQNNEMAATKGSAFEVQDKKYPTPRAWTESVDADVLDAMGRWATGESYRGINPSEVRWADPAPGYVWRRKVITDQLSWIINEIKTNPESRRLVATMWNASELENMALPPCHGALIQFYASSIDNELDLQVNIRSSDTFLGLPTNIAGYALLLGMVAQVTNRSPRTLTVVLGDAHVYKNHISQVQEQITRKPLPFPTLEIDKSITNIDDFRPEHFTLHDYQHLSRISAPVSV